MSKKKKKDEIETLKTVDYLRSRTFDLYVYKNVFIYILPNINAEFKLINSLISLEYTVYNIHPNMSAAKIQNNFVLPDRKV